MKRLAALLGPLFIALIIATPVYAVDAFFLDPVSTSDMSTCTEGVKMGLSSGATNRKALKFTGTSDRNCTKNLTTTSAGQDIIVRARGISSGGYPTMKVYLDNTVVGTHPMTTVNWGDFRSTVSVPAGSHTLKIEATNMASGRELWVDTMHIPAAAPTADTTPPNTSLTNITSPTNDNTPTFSFSGTDNVGVTAFDCRVDAGKWAACTSPHTTATLSDGSHTFEVRAKDAAGNVDATPASQTFTVDTTSASRCKTNLYPGDDLVAIAKACPGGTVFNVHDGDHTPVTESIPVQSSDVWQGVYSDATRPEVKTTTALFVFNAEGSTGATIRGLAVSGGQGPVGCKPKCGRGVHGGSNLLLDNIRAHHNANQGVGGQGDGLVIQNSELDNNGYGSNRYFYDDSGTASAAGVKTINTLKVLNSYIHDNSWNGVWCDIDCDYMEVRDSRIVRNGKSGIFYEITSGFTSPISVVEGNIIQSNGDIAAPMNRQPAGLSVNSSTNLDVYGNTFGVPGDPNIEYGIWAIDDSRAFVTDNINFHDNIMNGDGLRGCDLPGVSCNNN